MPVTSASRVEFQDAILAIPAEKFKVAFLNWYAESEHAGWDGFGSSEVEIFDKFVTDFVAFYQNDGLASSGYFSFGSYQIYTGDSGDVPTEQPIAEIRRWSKVEISAGAKLGLGYLVMGHIYNDTATHDFHPIPDGTYTNTSEVMEELPGNLIRTRNSLYRLAP